MTRQWKELSLCTVVSFVTMILQIKTTFCIDCGQELIGMKGRISSPKYPYNYPNNANCTWIIQSPVLHHEIILKMRTFKIEPQALCRYDYIEVGSGRIPGHNILGKYCGFMKPNPMKSTTGVMWLRFFSDYEKTYTGFRATWKVKEVPRNSNIFPNPPIKNKCGETFLRNKYGTLKSPRFPRKYPYDLQCLWIISLPVESRIVIRFEYFDLEGASKCRFDYLTVRDGEGESSPIIGKYCGTSKPATITTTGNSASIKFHSDSSIVRGGFLILWNSGETDDKVTGGPTPTTIAPTASTTPAISGCGAQLTEQHGQLQSPSYPNFYPEDTRCTWIISVKKPSRIRLSFSKDFDVEEDQNCVYDYVSVRDGAHENAKEIGRFCGKNAPDAIISYSSSLYITFRSDKSRVGKGFVATWVTADDQEFVTTTPVTTPRCGGSFSGTSGIITSPGYPLMYPSNQQCLWLLSMPPGHNIRLKFDYFNLEVDVNCAYDYVLIRDGAESDSAILGRFCGQYIYTKKGSIYSSGRDLRIQFHSDGSNSRGGFRISWERIIQTSTTLPTPTTKPNRLGPGSNGRHKILTGCGGDFELGYHSGTIFSPGYPERYQPNLSCTWTLKVPYTSLVSLSFNEFELEDSADCTSDYVVVRDGALPTSPLLGKYCGTEVPVYILSTGNELSLNLRTNRFREAKGFEISWMIYQRTLSGPFLDDAVRKVPRNKCEKHPGTLVGEAMISQIENKCQWNLHASENNQIQLDFADFDFGDTDTSSCSEDFVEIINGLTVHAPVIAKFCSNKKPYQIISSGRHVTIRYVMSGKISTNLKINYAEVGNKKSDKDFLINREGCGSLSLYTKTPNADKRRVKSQLGEWPWQAALMKSGMMVTCGGVLIAPQWVIGAAHCFKRSLGSTEWLIKLGSVDVHTSGKFEQVFKIQTVYIHPDYNSKTNENDIALIKLHQPAKISEYVNTICLPDESTSKLYEAGNICYAAGWGIKETFGDQEYPLSSIALPVVSNIECSNRDFVISDTMLCAGFSSGVDTCQGDGGGALMCKSQSGFVAIGISSVGKGCKHYGVYTDIRSYLDWIKIQMFT